MSMEARSLQDVDTIKKPIFDNLATIVEKVSLDKLNVSTRNKLKFNREETGSKSIVHGKWMSMILLCGPDMEITFKVHYNTSVGRNLLAKSSRKTAEEIPHEKIQDFFREFCNICAGDIKQILSKQNIVIGLSLPLSVRGSDQVMFSQRPQYFDNSSFWQIASDAGSLVCSVHLELLRPDSLTHLKVPDEPIKTKKRKIAFL